MLKESLANVSINPLEPGVLPQETFRQVTSIFNKKKIYPSDPRFPYYFVAKDNKKYLLFQPDESRDTVSCHSGESLKKVGDFHYVALGSTLEPFDNEGKDVAIHIQPSLRRFGLGRALVKYAMTLTGATGFVRSEKETELGKEFFPKMNESKRIQELFDSDLSDVVVQDDDDQGDYRMVIFDVGDNEYNLTLEADVDKEYGALIDVYFHIVTDNGYDTKLQSFQDQGIAFKVFTFTGKIIKETIEKLGNVRGLRFSALATEPSRVRFYRTMATAIQKKIFNNPNPVREVVEKDDIVFYPENIKYVNSLKGKGLYYESSRLLNEARAVFDYYQDWFYGKDDFDRIIKTLDSPKYETWLLDNLVRNAKAYRETKIEDLYTSLTFISMVSALIKSWDKLSTGDKALKAGFIPSKDLNVALKVTREKHKTFFGDSDPNRNLAMAGNNFGTMPIFYWTLKFLIDDAEEVKSNTSEFPGISVPEDEYKIVYKKGGWIGVQVFSQKASYQWGRKTVPNGRASTCVSSETDTYFSNYMERGGAKLMYFRQYPWTDKGLCVYYSDEKVEISDLQNNHEYDHSKIPDIKSYPEDIVEYVNSFIGKDDKVYKYFRKLLKDLDINSVPEEVWQNYEFKQLVEENSDLFNLTMDTVVPITKIANKVFYDYLDSYNRFFRLKIIELSTTSQPFEEVLRAWVSNARRRMEPEITLANLLNTHHEIFSKKITCRIAVLRILIGFSEDEVNSVYLGKGTTLLLRDIVNIHNLSDVEISSIYHRLYNIIKENRDRMDFNSPPAIGNIRTIINTCYDVYNPTQYYHTMALKFIFATEFFKNIMDECLARGHRERLVHICTNGIETKSEFTPDFKLILKNIGAEEAGEEAPNEIKESDEYEYGEAPYSDMDQLEEDDYQENSLFKLGVLH